jgi:hypothetical protein
MLRRDSPAVNRKRFQRLMRFYRMAAIGLTRRTSTPAPGTGYSYICSARPVD